MKGDFTRFTFDASKQYSQVLTQQGRVTLDADWNESVAMGAYLERTRTRDVIGLCGVPKENAGMGVTPTANGTDLDLSSGHIYVDGQLVQVGGGMSYANQPHLPNPPALDPEDDRSDLVYVDVWQRHVTAVEDPELLEKALGGADTTTRLQTVWQVKVLPDVVAESCDELGDELPILPPLSGRGRFSNGTAGVSNAGDPCLISDGGGYRGLENRLYRVEIHEGGGLGTATFKWSRDNGSILFPIAEFVAGEPTRVRVKRLGRDQVLTMHVGDFVEVLGDTTELNGLPGTMSAIAPNGIDEAEMVLTLGADVSGHSAEAMPKVRKWDGELGVVNAGIIELEDGITIEFNGGNYVTGDYWTFAARTADGSIEILNDAPPQGIEHNYCPLALVHWQATDGEEVSWENTTVDDCRPTFPPLTHICAEDVCYDNSNCDDIQATNVQEAIDQLCAQRDLRHHNKHLHGWGIVCGLQVHCGDDDIDVPGDRATVTVRPGYALDCEGNDIVLDEDMSVNVLELIRAYEAENPNMPLIIDGEGDVCLVVGRDERGDPVVELRPYDPNRNNLQSLLKDTFWMDVFQDCIQEPLNQLREILFPDNDDGNNIPVTPARRQLIALLNLVIQFFNPQYGSHVFISRKEDAILRLVYQVLRALLQSHTFCAMFDNARPFPEYPFGRDLQMSTIFDLTLRTRLRVHPNGRLGFAVGYDDRIHVYNLEEEELIAQLDMPGGTGLVARDVAFSQDGNQIYAVGTLRDEDSILAPGKVTERGEVEWEDIHIICEGLLVTMVRMPDSENTLLAVAEGRGLYIINPDNVIPNAEPNVAFNASGHLVVDGRGQRAYASANSDENNVFAETFDRVHEISWETQEILRTFRLPQAFTGMDDIAIMPASGRTPATLYAVAQTQQNEKQILAYRGSEDMPFAMIATLGDTTLRLQPIPNQPLMAVTYEDYYLLSLVDTVRQTTTEYQLPVQISPIGMAVSSELEMLYVVNGLSQTINNIGLRHLVPNADGDLPPGSPQFIEAMRRYRADVIAAYLDLAGGLLQWLKDCICDHLLVNCPTCDDEDEIYLGCVSIRGGEVYKVCNFSQRKYVHSFPTVEYWMSMIPILPLVDYAVEQVCCLVLPDLFGRFQVPGQDANRGSSFQGKQARSGFGYYKAGTLGTDVQGILGRVTIGRGLTGDWLGSRIQKATVSPSFGQKTRVLGSRDLYNKPVAEATRRAELANVTVAGVEKYDASLGLKNLVEVGKMPASLPAGESIKLYERDGVVRYFSVVKTPTVGRIATASATADVATLQSKISAMETELAELRAFRDEVRSFMASQDNGK